MVNLSLSVCNVAKRPQNQFGEHTDESYPVWSDREEIEREISSFHS